MSDQEIMDIEDRLNRQIDRMIGKSPVRKIKKDEDK